MKIGQEHPNNIIQVRNGSGMSSVSGKVSSFHYAMLDNQIHLAEDRLKHLMEDISALGEHLGRQPSLQALIKYKRTISEFLGKVMERSLLFKKDDYFDRRGQHNIYALVKKVDTKLEALTQEIIRKEDDNLSTLGLVDEIRGLLMDLLV